jgi:hypothetical protein
LPIDKLANLQDEVTALLRAVTVFPDRAIYQVMYLVPQNHYRYYHDRPPIFTGEAAIVTPSDERALLQNLERLEEQADQDGTSDALRKHLNEEITRRANDFLDDHHNGFYAPDVNFKKAQAEALLMQCSDALRTLRSYLSRFPFHYQAEAARERAEELETLVTQPGRCH